MFLKIISVIALVFQAAIKIADYLSHDKEQKAGRKLEQEENEKVVMERANEADVIRGGKLDDDLLCAPAERGAGRVPGLSADLFERKGSAAGGGNGSGNGDQSAQQDLGEQLFTAPKRKVTRVFIHCSDSDHAQHDNVETIDAWHKERGWKGIGYHYYIDKQGQLHDGRKLEELPAAQAGNNARSIAICCGGKSYFTVAQFYKLADFCEAINSEYLKLGQRVSFHGHCEVSCKTCPNFDYKNVLGLDDNGYII